MKPEGQARQIIDYQLIQSGWIIQNMAELNLGAAKGIAVREFPLKSGYADYLLFIDRNAVGVIEAKKEGTILLTVAEQSAKYSTGLPENIPHVHTPLPFLYESTGVETFFRDLRDPEPRSRRVFSFHKPETLLEWSEEAKTIRGRVLDLPPLVTDPLRKCQIEAITNLDVSLKENRPRALIQMATGSGKTYTAATFIYRLIKYSGAKRVLFLVDRGNLGNNALDEFQQYITPDDGRKFVELYNVQLMKTNTIDTVSKVCITTIQRMYSMLKGEREFDEENETKSGFDIDLDGDAPLDVEYNSSIPIETFDFVVVDECHRSIYNLWRQVLEYFDAFLIGLTATPAKQTFGFFHQNLIMEYNHERAVADGVNVGFEVYRIKTKISEEGSKIDASYNVYKRDKVTRRQRWERLDEDIVYSKSQLDKSVVSVNQIRLIIKTFKEKLFNEIYPGRCEVPKTLIFAKDDSHANDIVQIIREEFGKGNDFCKKVTYNVKDEKPQTVIKSFRNSYNPRIAVTVDMIATGTDIKPLEIVIFMRDIKSRVYFEQMKGRGTRVISDTDLKSVTGDAKSKTHFVIVDAVGVCDSEKQDSKPLERKKGIGFRKLMDKIAYGDRSEENISSIAGRLARLDRQINEKQRDEIENSLNGTSLSMVINGLLDSIDTDKQIETAKTKFNTDSPDEEQHKKVSEELINKACTVFDKPKVRDVLEDIKKKNEQIIDEISQDKLIDTGYDEQAKARAMQIVGTFKEFIEQNKDEITAIQFFYSQPYSKRHLTFEAVKELAEVIQKPPFLLTADKLWHAYEQLEKNKVQGASQQRVLTDMVSLLRFTLGKEEVLRPFEESINERFENWLEKQRGQGVDFTEEQVHWLTMIKDHIATSMGIEMDDFGYAPFQNEGGAVKAYNLFGEKLETILEELTDGLVA